MRTPYQLAMLRAAIVCFVMALILFGLGIQSAHAQTASEIAQQVATYHQEMESDEAAWEAASWVVAGNFADIISTELVLARPGFYELNPILGQSRGRRLAVKAAGTVVQVLLVRKIATRHPQLAKVVGYSIGAAMMGATAWNVSQLRRRR